jgi:EAL domain-containing protein (putative c-di-GMP-specific phosphodiesterase class I)
MLDKMKEFYKTLGIETAVDDYGTGYSNIVNLLRYMPDYVKIDRMLLSNIQENPQKQHFVREIVLFAHDNHFMVLAEGIETKEELETVIKLKVDLIQGYYTARPSAEVIPEIDEEIANQIKEFSSI